MVTESGNSNEFILYSRGKRTFLSRDGTLRASFIMCLMVFATVLVDTFKVLDIFQID